MGDVVGDVVDVDGRGPLRRCSLEVLEDDLVGGAVRGLGGAGAKRGFVAGGEGGFVGDASGVEGVAVAVSVEEFSGEVVVFVGEGDVVGVAGEEGDVERVPVGELGILVEEGVSGLVGGVVGGVDGDQGGRLVGCLEVGLDVGELERGVGRDGEGAFDGGLRGRIVR